jgi:hypothetical protein
MNVIISLSLVIIFILGIVYLQLFLSKSTLKWPGIILPGINFLFSVLVAVSVVPFTTTKSSTVVNEAGQVISETIIHAQNQNVLSTLLLIAFIFVAYNIPTVLLMAIYTVTRRKMKRNMELVTMSIQDL